MFGVPSRSGALNPRLRPGPPRAPETRAASGSVHRTTAQDEVRAAGAITLLFPNGVQPGVQSGRDWANRDQRSRHTRRILANGAVVSIPVDCPHPVHSRANAQIQSRPLHCSLGCMTPMTAPQAALAPTLRAAMDHVVGPLRRLLRRVALAVVVAQAAAAGGLIAVDSWRKRMRPREATFPRTEAADLPLGESITTVYTYGTVLYEDMLAAIEGARERVLFESFIVKDDEVGQRFKAALIAAAERGVEVFVIYDVFANLVVKRAFFEFPPSVNVVRYPALKPGMLLLDVRKSGRDHRKLLVVDGEIGFVGGYNVGSAYATQWRDTHLRVRGPSAWELENAFVDFWKQHARRRRPARARLDPVGVETARASQCALAAGLPDPWHVPRGDRPRVRAHLDHPAVLHPRPDDGACAAGRSPARR